MRRRAWEGAPLVARAADAAALGEVSSGPAQRKVLTGGHTGARGHVCDHRSTATRPNSGWARQNPFDEALIEGTGGLQYRSNFIPDQGMERG
jgi:hypothetical protein